MERIEGTVEDIIFKNEENGYVVADIDSSNELITIVGCIPFISEGLKIRASGDYVNHHQFGRQFKVSSCEEIAPSSVEEIERYLSSGIITGIGPVTAKKITEKFGEDTFDILDNNIEKLSEIEGLGDKKIKTIAESYTIQRQMRNIIVFFQEYGIGANQCVKIYKKYGTDSISKVKNNPYILSDDIYGIGFKTADRIAFALGIDKNSSFRLQSGVRYIINKFCGLGNTYMVLDKLVKEAASSLGISSEEIEKSIYESVIDQKLKIDEIDNVKCVFNLMYYYAEEYIASKLISLCLSDFLKIDANIEDEIKKFEEKNNIYFADNQKGAILGAFNDGVEIITGGPGTGKTTIINCICDIYDECGLKVYLAAPTGRAAKRMTEATGREAKTIHRLLELGFNNDDDLVFFKNDEAPLDCDVLIIDEASMIDVMVMNSLLKAVVPGMRLIIVGDSDQLPSVGPGNILRDIIESDFVKVVKLNRIFRQGAESMIVVNAHKINKGEMPLLNEKNKDFYFIRVDNTRYILNTIIELVNERLPKFNEEWDKMKSIQILSPMRKGELGIYNLNKSIQNILNPSSKNKSEKEFRNTIFRVGDKVMQIKNDYTLKWQRATKENADGEKEGMGVFNGDVGIIQEINNDDNTVTVLFDDERNVEYENSNLEELELAYAITIHKSQGSEFPVVVMPAFMGAPLLMNRNLLYTGITRAKKLVVMVGSMKAINYMVNNNSTVERYSSLKWRIRQNIMDKK